MNASSQPCPCGSGQSAASCCEPVLAETTQAATAEALMRSRYTAYVSGNESWLLASWHPSTRPTSVEFNPDQRWLGLKVLRAQENDSNALVEFVARFKIAGRAYRLHEVSRFSYSSQGWLYVEGTRGATDSSQQD